MRAEKLLDELEKSAGPLKQESDREAINEEERFMLRKVGLRMKPFLLLGELLYLSKPYAIHGLMCHSVSLIVYVFLR